MNLGNCGDCGKLMTGAAKLCMDCLRARIELTHMIKNFLREHPKASIKELYEHTGIPLSKINELVKRA